MGLETSELNGQLRNFLESKPNFGGGGGDNSLMHISYLTANIFLDKVHATGHNKSEGCEGGVSLMRLSLLYSNPKTAARSHILFTGAHAYSTGKRT